MAFVTWCDQQGLCSLPAAPQTVALYLAARADKDRKVATIELSLTTISQAHLVAGHGSPRSDRLVKETWKGIRRRLGIAKQKKDPLTATELRRMVDAMPSGLLGLRDRALVLLGFAGGFRRSELVALNSDDLKFVPEGLEALVRRSKTDQEGEGLTKMIACGSDPATCPVRAVQDWLALSGISEGPVFRSISRHERLGDKHLSDFAVAVIIKRHAKKAGLSIPQLSGHSLRAGFVTEAKKNGADYPVIMDQTGHTKLDTVHGYNRRKKKWQKPASAKLGL
jgi:integrase